MMPTDVSFMHICQIILSTTGDSVICAIATTSETNFLIPFKAASGVADNQLKLGN
jgi:hypothetical protein